MCDGNSGLANAGSASQSPQSGGVTHDNVRMTTRVFYARKHHDSSDSQGDRYMRKGGARFPMRAGDYGSRTTAKQRSYNPRHNCSSSGMNRMPTARCTWNDERPQSMHSEVSQQLSAQAQSNTEKPTDDVPLGENLQQKDELEAPNTLMDRDREPSSMLKQLDCSAAGPDSKLYLSQAITGSPSSTNLTRNVWQDRREFVQSALPNSKEEEEEMVRKALELSRLEEEERLEQEKLFVCDGPLAVEDMSTADGRDRSVAWPPLDTPLKTVDKISLAAEDVSAHGAYDDHLPGVSLQLPLLADAADTSNLFDGEQNGKDLQPSLEFERITMGESGESIDTDEQSMGDAVVTDTSNEQSLVDKISYGALDAELSDATAGHVESGSVFPASSSCLLHDSLSLDTPGFNSQSQDAYLISTHSEDSGFQYDGSVSTTGESFLELVESIPQSSGSELSVSSSQTPLQQSVDGVAITALPLALQDSILPCADNSSSTGSPSAGGCQESADSDNCQFTDSAISSSCSASVDSNHGSEDAAFWELPNRISAENVDRNADVSTGSDCPTQIGQPVVSFVPPPFPMMYPANAVWPAHFPATPMQFVHGYPYCQQLPGPMPFYPTAWPPCPPCLMTSPPCIPPIPPPGFACIPAPYPPGFPMHMLPRAPSPQLLPTAHFYTTVPPASQPTAFISQ